MPKTKVDDFTRGKQLDSLYKKGAPKMTHNKWISITLVAIVFLSLGCLIGHEIGNLNQSGLPHTDWYCGTITSPDGSRQPIKISIEDEMSFDLRMAPGMLELYRCDIDTPLSSID